MKNKTLRIASLLLVLTLITACIVSGTFAKYITTNTANDNATVAYWGLSTPASVTLDLFNVSTTDTGIAADGLIAPGSAKTMDLEFINAKTGNKAPEVAYKVTFDTTGSVAPSGNLDAAVDWYVNETKYPDWNAFIAAIKNLSGEADGIAEYAPGTDLPAALQNGKTTTIGWAWAFGDGSTDVADTALGNADPLDTVTLKIAVTVEQLNTYTAPAQG